MYSRRSIFVWPSSLSMWDSEGDAGTFGFGGRNRQLAAQSAYPLLHTREPITFWRHLQVKATAIIHDSQVEPGVFEPQFDADRRTFTVTRNVIQGFLENQQHVAADVGSDALIRLRRLALLFYVPATEDFAGKPSHAVDEIRQMISFWIDCPDYVSHRS